MISKTVSRLRSLRALTFSPNANEAASARRKLEQLMQEAGVKSETDLDELLSAEVEMGSFNVGDNDSMYGVETLTDWGLYVDSRQSRYLLMHCVAFTVGWDRWDALVVRKRHRKYIFVGVTRPEADYIAEIFQIHSKGLEKAMLDAGVHTSQIGRASTRDTQQLQDACRIAYLTVCNLRIPGREYKTASTEEMENDPVLRSAARMMWRVSKVDTPVKYDRRIAHPAARTLTSSQGRSKPRQLTDGEL